MTHSDSKKIAKRKMGNENNRNKLSLQMLYNSNINNTELCQSNKYKYKNLKIENIHTYTHNFQIYFTYKDWKFEQHIKVCKKTRHFLLNSSFCSKNPND